jgi:hypothetical protein
MRIVGFVEREQQASIKKLLTRVGLWQEPNKPEFAAVRAPPAQATPQLLEVAKPSLDYGYFDQTCA